MKIIMSLMILASFNVNAQLFDNQKFCCKRPQQQNPNMCIYKSFNSTVGCPQSFEPATVQTNSLGQAYVNAGACPVPDGTIAACEE